LGYGILNPNVFFIGKFEPRMPDDAIIFIVEDDPLFVDMYKTAFEGAGYTVDFAFDGETGLKKLKEMPQKPSVLLLDVMMPRMNGIDMLKAMKGEEPLKAIPVIFLTNLSGAEDARHALEHGAVTYLVKSQYTPKEVVQKVREIVEAYSRGERIPDVQVEVKKSE